MVIPRSVQADYRQAEFLVRGENAFFAVDILTVVLKIVLALRAAARHRAEHAVGGRTGTCRRCRCAALRRTLGGLPLLRADHRTRRGLAAAGTGPGAAPRG